MTYRLFEIPSERSDHRLIENDPIGTLTQSLTRLNQADFIVVSAQNLYERFPNLKGCTYLLFATHSLRELEGELDRNELSLTYYAFSTDLSQPVNSNGASPIDVRETIAFLKDRVIRGLATPSPEAIEQAKLAGRQISEWVQNSFGLGGDDFLEGDLNYFAPVPVALIAIVVENLEIKKYSAETIKADFVNLASQWSQDVEGMSSTVEMIKHPAYQQIVSMGQAVVPFLLEDLRQNPIYWLPALREITQQNPVQPEQRGKIKQMAEAWLNWGKQEGYII